MSKARSYMTLERLGPRLMQMFKASRFGPAGFGATLACVWGLKPGRVA